MCFPAIVKIITKKLNMRHDVEWVDVVHFKLKHGDGRKKKRSWWGLTPSQPCALLKATTMVATLGGPWRRIKHQGLRMFEMRPLLS